MGLMFPYGKCNRQQERKMFRDGEKLNLLKVTLDIGLTTYNIVRHHRALMLPD